MRKYTKKVLRVIKRFLINENLKNIQSSPTHEIKKSFGKAMPEKIFYIIGVDEGWCGLYAIIMHQLTHIAYAIERGYIPVIDLQNFNSQYLAEKVKFKVNAWEYFFEQPSGYGLNDIKRAKNVIKSVCYPDPPDDKYRIKYDTTIYDPDAISYWSKVYKTYVRFNQNTEKFLQNKFDSIFKNKTRVLGVLCRGTDYITLEPNNHPIQPEPIEVISLAKKSLEKWNCDFIYLATEDADIYDLFIEHFPDKLILDNVNRWRTKDIPNGASNSDLLTGKSELEKYDEGLKYLSQIYLLSKCTCLIAGNTFGSLGVILMSDGFEKYFIFNLGLIKNISRKNALAKMENKNASS